MYIIIAGGGRLAEYLAQLMTAKGHRVALIEIKEDVADRLAASLPNQTLIVCGDACDSSVQHDAGASSADVFVAVTGKDEDNLVACEIAQLAYGIPRILARVNMPRNERIFRQMGIEAVSSTIIIAQMIEEEVGLGAVQTALALSRQDIEMHEAVIPSIKSGRGNKAALRAKDIRLPKGTLLAAVRRGGESEIVSADTLVYPGDSVVFISKGSDAQRVREILNAL